MGTGPVGKAQDDEWKGPPQKMNPWLQRLRNRWSHCQPRPQRSSISSVRPGDHPSDWPRAVSKQQEEASINPFSLSKAMTTSFFLFWSTPRILITVRTNPISLMDREAISYPIPMSYSKSLDRLVERGYDQREEGLGRWGEGLIILTRPDLFILTRWYKPHPSLLVRVHKKGLKIDGKKGPCFTGVKVSTTYVEISFFR